MQTDAILLSGPRQIARESVKMTAPADGDIVVETRFSGISTGTEKLFYSGEMPPFPGMGYPLVPGYEAMGEVVEAGQGSGFAVGDHVFVPGANCYDGAFGLFGAASAHLISAPSRVVRVDPAMQAQGALLALAATARHAVAGLDKKMPDLIVGHGTFGRLLARLTVAAGAPAPTVWERNPARHGVTDYPVIDPKDDTRRDYKCIYDASGDASLLNELITRIARGGEIVLAGFYTEPLSFAFPPAFMKEARLRIAAEWVRDDLIAVRNLIDTGALSLDGLITHERAASDAQDAYRTAFDDPSCLKMILNWSQAA